MNCTSVGINLFKTIEEKCNFVSNNCSSDYINFYSIHYCYFKGSIILSSVIVIMFLILLFFLLSSTSDIFLSTSITKIVETFDINQNIAGVTLLAFGNGAPDVISSLVASDDMEGITFSISSLIGGGMFVTSFVLGSIVFKGKNILVNSNMFNRDLFLYIISLLYIIIISYKQRITLIYSLIFILIYSISIILAFYQGTKQKEDNINEHNFISEENKLIIDEILNEGESKIENIKLGKEIELIQKQNSVNDFYREYMNVPVKQKENIINNQIIGEIKDDIIKEQKFYVNKKSYSETWNENIIMAKINFKKKFYYYKEIEWNEIAFYYKFLYIFFDCPLTFIRELTIPITENKRWNKNKFCLLPLCDFFFFSYVFKCKFLFIIS